MRRDPSCRSYIESWEGHNSELAKKYPLQLITPHPRYQLSHATRLKY